MEKSREFVLNSAPRFQLDVVVGPRHSGWKLVAIETPLPYNALTWLSRMNSRPHLSEDNFDANLSKVMLREQRHNSRCRSSYSFAVCFRSVHFFVPRPFRRLRMIF